MRAFEYAQEASAGGASLEARPSPVGLRRVGVLTFHRCINYGSYWQARCLVEGLREAGFDAVLLDHHSARVDRVEWRCALEPQGRASAPPADRRSHARKTRRFMEAFGRLPLSRRFGLEAPPPLENYDAIVVGSDEVWNLRHPWYGGYAFFYGADIKAGRLVSYAASFGNHDAAEGLEPYWCDQLRRFDAIAVRDENSARLIRGALGIEPALVLDPCLQFPPRVPGESERREPYIAVYGHSFPWWYQEAVRHAAAALGCRLLSIGYRNDWADEQDVEAGPEDFARLMAGAEAIATNFFHGCVFALLNGKPFACVASEYRSNKVRDLTALLGVESRLVGEDNLFGTIGELLSTPLDASVSRQIESLRRRSDAYLASALH